MFVKFSKFVLRVICWEEWPDQDQPEFRQEVSDFIKINHPPRGLRFFLNNGQPLKIGENEVKCQADGGYPQIKID